MLDVAAFSFCRFAIPLLPTHGVLHTNRREFAFLKNLQVQFPINFLNSGSSKTRGVQAYRFVVRMMIEIFYVSFHSRNNNSMKSFSLCEALTKRPRKNKQVWSNGSIPVDTFNF